MWFMAPCTRKGGVMGFASIHSCAMRGMQLVSVTVEVHLAGGLPGFTVIGLPAGAVRESKVRVETALRMSRAARPTVR